MSAKTKITSPANKLFDNKIPEDEKLLTRQEIADFLQVSIKTIDKKVMLNEIPFFKIGKSVRFSKQRVLEWSERGLQAG
jgi:excisionase family DNA binding protein